MELNNNKRKRIQVRIGDVFEITLENKFKGYFQFIMLDKSQLNSDIIRVFKEKYPIDYNPNISDIIKGEVSFYAHVPTMLGYKQGLWDKVGKAKLEVDAEIPNFRNTNDVMDPNIKKSENWHVWKANEEFVSVGRLNTEQRKYDIGIIVTPQDIQYKMNNGHYGFRYPDFK